MHYLVRHSRINNHPGAAANKCFFATMISSSVSFYLYIKSNEINIFLRSESFFCAIQLATSITFPALFSPTLPTCLSIKKRQTHPFAIAIQNQRTKQPIFIPNVPNPTLLTPNNLRHLLCPLRWVNNPPAISVPRDVVVCLADKCFENDPISSWTAAKS